MNEVSLDAAKQYIDPTEGTAEKAPAPVEPTEDTPNIHEDIEATVVVDDAKTEV